jgi:hypothetical protein
MVKVRLNDVLRTGLLESLSLNVSVVFVAGAVGVPLIAPVEASSDSPAGRVPLVSDHLYGLVPPVAASVALYADPTWPFGSEVVTTASALDLVFALAVDEQTARNRRQVKTVPSEMSRDKLPPGRQAFRGRQNEETIMVAPIPFQVNV